MSKKGSPLGFSKFLGCDDNPFTIYSEDDEDKVDEQGGGNQVTVKLLVSSDLIGCEIKTGNQIVQIIQNETGAQIQILKDERLPPCALSSNELVQIYEETTIMKKQIYGTNGRVTMERSHYFVDIQLVHQ
ncbi:K-like proteiny domain, type 1 [Sesbania bispinosa]|nr:K-like proteiny domain, type 1 [Sesbania bispinosa]